MKKKLLLLVAVLMLLGCCMLASCDLSSMLGPGAGGGAKPITGYKFENVSTVYDGTPKTMAVTGLPEGSTVLYSVNGGEATSAVSVTDAGTYTVVAKITPPAGYAAIGDLTATLTIAKAAYTLPALEGDEAYFENTEVAYDGISHLLEPAHPLPDGVGYRAVGEPVRDVGSVGTYRVEFWFSDSAMANNYNPPAPIEGLTLTVVKADIDMSGIRFEDAERPYTGKSQKLAITGNLDPRLSVRYTGGGTDQGTHEVKAIFSFKNEADEANYNLPAPMTAILTISKGEYDLSEYSFNNKSYDYTSVDEYPSFDEPAGLDFIITVKKDGVEVTEVKLPGVYEVEVRFEADEDAEFLAPAPRTYTITIHKGTLSGLEAPTWQPIETWDFTLGHLHYFYLNVGGADGVKLILPAGLLDEDKGKVTIHYAHTRNGVALPEGAAFDAAGLYETTATITYESDYYVLPESFSTVYTFTWVLADKEANAADITFDDASFVYDGAAKTIAATYDAAYVKEITYYLSVGGELVPFTGVSNVGSYTVVAVVETDPTSGYAPFAVEATLTVTAATLDLSGITFEWNYTEPFVVDGTTHTVTLTAKTVAELEKIGVTVTYEGNTATEKGTYTATAKLACDDDHELAESDLTRTFTFILRLADEDSWTDPVQ